MTIRTDSGFNISLFERVPMNRLPVRTNRILYREPDKGHPFGILMAAGACLHNLPAVHGRVRITGFENRKAYTVAVATNSRDGPILFCHPAVPGTQIGFGLFLVASRTGDRRQFLWMGHGTGIPMTHNTANLSMGRIRQRFKVHRGNAARFPAVAQHTGVIWNGLSPHARGGGCQEKQTDGYCCSDKHDREHFKFYLQLYSV